jgi:hypothetical protein
MSFKVGPRCGRVDNYITDSDAEIYFAWFWKAPIIGDLV